jgi:transposase
MENPAAKAVYRQRKIIAEPMFGQSKSSGFRGFSVRTKEKWLVNLQ